MVYRIQILGIPLHRYIHFMFFCMHFSFFVFVGAPSACMLHTVIHTVHTTCPHLNKNLRYNLRIWEFFVIRFAIKFHFVEDIVFSCFGQEQEIHRSHSSQKFQRWHHRAICFAGNIELDFVEAIIHFYVSTSKKDKSVYTENDSHKSKSILLADTDTNIKIQCVYFIKSIVKQKLAKHFN